MLHYLELSPSAEHSEFPARHPCLPPSCTTCRGAGQEHSIQQLGNVTAFRSDSHWGKCREISHSQQRILLARQLLAIIFLFSQCSPGWQCSKIHPVLLSTEQADFRRRGGRAGRGEAPLLSLDCCCQRNTFEVSVKRKKDCC